MLLSYFSTTGALVPFATQDYHTCNEYVQIISKNIMKNCMSASFLTRNGISIEGVISQWINSFWLNIADYGTPTH